jgi:hypothetical protein
LKKWPSNTHRISNLNTHRITNRQLMCNLERLMRSRPTRPWVTANRRWRCLWANPSMSNSRLIRQPQSNMSSPTPSEPATQTMCNPQPRLSNLQPSTSHKPSSIYPLKTPFLNTFNTKNNSFNPNMCNPLMSNPQPNMCLKLTKPLPMSSQPPSMSNQPPSMSNQPHNMSSQQHNMSNPQPNMFSLQPSMFSPQLNMFNPLLNMSNSPNIHHNTAMSNPIKPISILINQDKLNSNNE